MLGMKEFVVLTKQDDCVCTHCLTYFWVGLVEQTSVFFKGLNKFGSASGVWTSDTNPSVRLSKRLEKSCQHMRTTYGQHLKEHDEMTDHCLDQVTV